MKRKQLYLLSLAFLGFMGRSNAQCGFNYIGPVDSTSHISFGESEYMSTAVDPSTNTQYVAYRDGNNFYGSSVKKYVNVAGTWQWQQVGIPGFSLVGTSSEIYGQSLTIDRWGNPYLACEDKGLGNHCVVWAFNGTKWDTLPGQIAAFTSPASFISLTTDTNGVPYVAYQNGATAKMNVQMYNFTTKSWSPVGTSIAVSKAQAQYCQIAFDRVHNTPYVAFEDGFKPYHADKLMVEYFNGTNWVVPGLGNVANPVADTAGITTDTVNWVSLAIDKKGNVYVAYEDFSDGGNIGMVSFDSATSTWTTDTVNRNKYLGGPVTYLSAGVDSADNVYAAYEDGSYYGYSGLSIAYWSGTKNNWDLVGNSYKLSQAISAGVADYISLSVTNHGVPFVAYRDKSDGDHALAFQWSTSPKQWVAMQSTGVSNLNPGTWNGLASYVSIATQPGTNDPYISYTDENTGGNATVMMYSGSTWSSVGAPGSLSVGKVKFTNMGFDAAGDPICMFTDYGSATKYSISCMKYSGGAWAAVGTPSTLSGADAYYVDMTIVKDTIYAAFETSSYLGSVIKCAVNGTTWTNAGPVNIDADSASYESIAIDNNGIPYVAFSDNGANQNGITIVKLTPTGWALVGTRNISGGKAVNTSLKINPLTNMPVVAYSSYGAGTEANVEEWNGSTWVFVGAPGFSTDWTSSMSLAVDNNGAYYVSYDDWGNEVTNQGQYDVTVEKYDTKVDTAWRVLPLGGGSCSQNGASYEQCTVDANGNLYVAYCSYSAFVQELNCPAGVNEISNNNAAANVYPDPNNGSFTVALQNASEKSSISVFNVLGQNVYTAKLTADKTTVNMGAQTPGVYLYRIFDENGNTISTGKLVIQ